MVTPDLAFQTLHQQNFAYASLTTLPLTLPKEDKHVSTSP